MIAGPVIAIGRVPDVLRGAAPTGRTTDLLRGVSESPFRDAPDRLATDEQRAAAARELARRLMERSAVLRGEPAPRADEVVIESRDGLGRRQRPRVLVAGRAVAEDVSLSHDGGWAAAGWAPAGLWIGVDVVAEASLDLARPPWWLTETERRQLAVHGHARRFAAAQWAAKEACYKAENRGEPFAPLRLTVWWSPVGGWRTNRPLVRLQVWRIPDGVVAAAVRAPKIRTGDLSSSSEGLIELLAPQDVVGRCAAMLDVRASGEGVLRGIRQPAGVVR
jgi:hypothetical protein